MEEDERGGKEERKKGGKEEGRKEDLLYFDLAGINGSHGVTCVASNTIHVQYWPNAHVHPDVTTHFHLCCDEGR